MPVVSDIANRLPSNLDAERCVLGSILVNNAALNTAVRYVSSGDFLLTSHQKIFRHMLAMVEANQPIDLVTLCESMFKSGEIESCGVGDLQGAAYISSLMDGMATVSNVEQYARIVREKAALRILAKASERLSNAALEPNANLGELQSKLRAMAIDTPEPMKIVGGNGHLCYSSRDFLTAEFPTPEHLVEGVIPRGGSVLIFALPHRLKSWFTTALTIGCTRAGRVLGHLEVKKPVKTLLVQVEDFPGQLQWRIRELLRSPEYQDIDLDRWSVIPRCNMDLMKPEWFQAVYREIEKFEAEHVIFDVMRRIFRGDVNSPKESAALLEQVDRLREPFNCAVTIVHHANKKDSELMTGAAGSYNLPGWANVVIEFKRKTEEAGVTHVEIEVDNKLAPSPEPMRMVLDLASEKPLRMELLEDGVGIFEAEERLGAEWTVRDLAEVLDVHKTNAQRRLKKWISSGKVEKISAGKRGRSGGLARYRFCAGEDAAAPVHIRRLPN
jgi:KaiC/GvpD/RAD55 family RecA-like ATPase